MRNQIICFAAAIVGCVLWSHLGSPGSGGGPAAADKATAAAAGLGEELGPRPDGRRMTACAAQCDGEWTPQHEADRQALLEKEFLMIPHTRLKYRDHKEMTRPMLNSDASDAGWLVFYVFMAFYMFAALAIVCDEFFVPALEAFVDDFGISMDVAGATFMAAGGSMPELFTSFIATFQGSPEFGLGAIVGSAVFNVLFVIAVCAVSNSSDALELTWWPLARDCTFYIFALSTIAIVFRVTSPEEIVWWEALLLLFEYVLYCCFMKFNGEAHDLADRILEGEFSLKCWRRKSPAPSEGEEDPVGPSSPPGSKERVLRRATSDPPALEGKKARGPRKPTGQEQAQPGAPGAPKLNMPSMFRQGIVKLMSKNSALAETAGMAAVVQIKGSLEDTFRKLDVDGDGYLNPQEIRVLLDQMGLKHDSDALETVLRRLTHSGETCITFEVFKEWYLCSEARAEIEVRRVFDTYDRNGDQTLDKGEILELLKALGHKPTDRHKEEVDELISHIVQSHAAGEGAVDGKGPPPPETDAPGLLDKEETGEEQQACITYEQFEAWYTKSLFFRDQLKKQELQKAAAEDDGITLDAPEDPSYGNMVWYIGTYPLVAVLYCTLPDVRKEKFAKSKYHTWIAVLEFLLSLVWIGIFCVILYESTVVVANTIGMPTPVAACTVLAAGTSIPDLISSYIVARNGEGDMAVSSSIGSNIFDVTIGLPLPWISYIVIKGAPVAVTSKSLFFSVLVLIVMLLAVIFTIVINKWKLTKALGYVMMLLYVIYVLQFLLMNLPTDNPVFGVPFD